jgi:hypothetical protein
MSEMKRVVSIGALSGRRNLGGPIMLKLRRRERFALTFTLRRGRWRTRSTSGRKEEYLKELLNQTGAAENWRGSIGSVTFPAICRR